MPSNAHRRGSSTGIASALKPESMISETFKCSVCGGAMHRVKVLPCKLGRLTRYRCTCGHCEDLPDDKVPGSVQPKEDFVLEGFQEMP